MPNFFFVLLDHTTNKTPVNLAPASYFDRMIEAFNDQIQEDFAPNWGSVSAWFRKGTIIDRQKHEIAINFRDTIPEAPDALAYHQCINGVPDIEIGCDLFENMIADTNSMSSGVSHEILELLGDPGANGWKDMTNAGNETQSEELCDRVQNTGYQKKNSVFVSNFLLPSAFIPGSTAPWDFKNVMRSQYDLANGYIIAADAPANVQQIDGKIHGATAHKNKLVYARGIENLSPLSLKRKQHPYSRTYRRGVRL